MPEVQVVCCATNSTRRPQAGPGSAGVRVEYLASAGIGGDANGQLFRTVGRKTGQAQAMWQQDVYRMIQRRAAAAGIKTKIGNHTFRATGITAYLKNNGTLEHAQTLANHEVEKISI